MSDRGKGVYRVRIKEMPSPVTWPQKATGALLGEALQDRVITTSNHPVYLELTEGTDYS